MKHRKMQRHLERFEWSPNRWHPPDTASWPFNLPVVAQIIADGAIEIPPGVTFLAGENGSGKSTLIEAFADVYPRDGVKTGWVDNLGPRGSEEDSPLNFHLKARTHGLASRAGFFLRAEMMHEFLGSVDADPSQARAWGGSELQRQSHGESFLAVLRRRFEDVGVYFLDEPESALSFRSCLGLVSLLDTLRREGSQVIVATHSPILLSLPNANLLELGEHGIHRVESYDDLDIVRSWRHFLDTPDQFFRHLLDDE